MRMKIIKFNYVEILFSNEQDDDDVAQHTNENGGKFYLFSNTAIVYVLS